MDQETPSEPPSSSNTLTHKTTPTERVSSPPTPVTYDSLLPPPISPTVLSEGSSRSSDHRDQDTEQQDRALRPSTTPVPLQPPESSEGTTGNKEATGLESHQKSDDQYRKELHYWLDRFIMRYGLTFTKFVGERGDADEELCKQWIDSVYQYLSTAYPLDCIWNADETGLFYDQLPRYSYASAKGQAGGKTSKARISILLAASATGERRRPFIIGKQQSLLEINKFTPRPYDYQIQDNSWMTMDLFAQWLADWNKELRAMNKNIALIIDNCHCHKLLNHYSNISVYYLPPCQTAILQPLDQGIIRSFKASYRRLLVEAKYKTLEEKSSVRYVRPRMYARLICQAWKCVSSEVIVHCFRAAGWIQLKSEEGMKSKQEASVQRAAKEAVEKVVSGMEEEVVGVLQSNVSSEITSSMVSLSLPEEDEFAVEPFEHSEKLFAAQAVAAHAVQPTPDISTASEILSQHQINQSVATLQTLSESWKESEAKSTFQRILNSIKRRQHRKPTKYIQPSLFDYSKK